MPQTTKLQDYPLASHTLPKGSDGYRIPRRLRPILSLDDFETAARRLLPKPLFAYVSGGAEQGKSLRGNRAGFDRYAWVPHAFTDTSARSLDTSLLGQCYSAPFGIAPMGISGLTAFEGDLIQTRAAREANIPAIMSGSSLLPMETVVAANPDAWFQAYVPGEDAKILALIERVQRAGFRTLVVTADVPVSANRENLIRARFSTPLKPDLHLAWEGLTHPRWLLGTALKTLLRHGMPHFENSGVGRGAPILSANVMRDFGARDHLSWRHLELIRHHWQGTLVVKGILAPEDAVQARECGAEGVIVSNHGGRQLDGSIAPCHPAAGGQGGRAGLSGDDRQRLSPRQRHPRGARPGREVRLRRPAYELRRSRGRAARHQACDRYPGDGGGAQHGAAGYPAANRRPSRQPQDCALVTADQLFRERR
jgi:L-lactate dehydrogenase (cytochrome)